MPQSNVSESWALSLALCCDAMKKMFRVSSVVMEFLFCSGSNSMTTIALHEVAVCCLLFLILFVSLFVSFFATLLQVNGRCFV